jgi:hypothetical protein
MLVTFHTKAYADITMFGDVAVKLLKMMGHSGSVPGAFMAEDIPNALKNLREALQQQQTMPNAGNNEDEPPVSLSHRALPLVELLEAAIKQDTQVIWDK